MVKNYHYIRAYTDEDYNINFEYLGIVSASSLEEAYEKGRKKWPLVEYKNWDNTVKDNDFALETTGESQEHKDYFLDNNL